MPKKKKGMIIFITIVAVLFVVIWKYRNQFAPSNVLYFIKDSMCTIGRGEGFPKSIEGTLINRNNFQAMGKNLVYVNDTSVITLNRSAKEISNRQHSFATPILRLGGPNILTYNLNGKNLRIERKSEIVHNKSVDDGIISAAVSDNGTYVIITEPKGYSAAMTVYGAKSDDIRYKYCFSGCKVHDVAIDDDGKRIIVLGHDIVNESMAAQVYVFDCFHDEPIGKFDYKDTTMLSVEFLSHNKFAAVGDNVTSVVDIKNMKKNDYSYKNKVLNTFSCDKEQGIALVLAASAKSEKGEIVVLNLNGKQVHNIDVDMNISDISYKDTTIACISGNELICYKNFNNEKICKEIDTDAKRILLTSKSTAYILGVSAIKKIVLF